MRIVVLGKVLIRERKHPKADFKQQTRSCDTQIAALLLYVFVALVSDVNVPVLVVKLVTLMSMYVYQYRIYSSWW